MFDNGIIIRKEQEKNMKKTKNQMEYGTKSGQVTNIFVCVLILDNIWKIKCLRDRQARRAVSMHHLYKRYAVFVCIER